ncbi:hypothetical protein NP233_g6700 [Leucocoprinus birnbaumii]|uniref:DDE-1 domain-containing protein n=1 Tax=Leucocoprinus birnbaumii TaxID=56174 RepID=A0AAD5VSW1_9AGAR|nr:hypothetical protein NP233_g6700 [Leucocoprinus birnbaumii]
MPPKKITDFFSPFTSKEEKEEYWKIENQRTRERMLQEEAKKTHHSEDKKQRERELATKRKQNQREREKAIDIMNGIWDAEGKLIKKPKRNLVQYDTTTTASSAAANTNESTSTDNNISSKRAPPTNWFIPELWKGIDKVAHIHRFKTRGMVEHLAKGLNPELYTQLKPGTIESWIDRSGDVPRWSDKTLRKVAEGGKREIEKQVGRPRILVKHKALHDIIIRTILINREAGLPISVPMTQIMIRGYTEAMAPALIEQGFKCSYSFTRQLLSGEMGYSYRTGTCAAQKTPKDWIAQCEEMFFRVVYYSRMNGVPPEAIVNGDQMGIVLIPVGNHTWAPKGARQVDVFGNNKKRQFTLMVMTTCTGEILPFQAIWSGKTERSLPSSQVRKPAEDAGAAIFSLGGDNHWSTLPCVQEWIRKIVVPYLDQVRQKKKLERMNGCVIIDCWRVHRSKEFLTWMRTEFGWIKIAFIPGGCTGKFQPNDVGIQRIVKHIIRQEASNYFMAQVKRHVDSGARGDFTFNTDLPTLRNASVGWITKSFEYFKEHPELVLKAWEHSSTGIWNLSEACITNQGSADGLSEFLETRPSLILELAQARAATLPAETEAVTFIDDGMVDGINHDDDLTLTTDQLVQILHHHHDRSGLAINEVIQVSDDGISVLQKGVDDEFITPSAQSEEDSESDLEVDSNILYFSIYRDNWSNHEQQPLSRP